MAKFCHPVVAWRNIKAAAGRMLVHLNVISGEKPKALLASINGDYSFLCAIRRKCDHQGAYILSMLWRPVKWLSALRQYS